MRDADRRKVLALIAEMQAAAKTPAEKARAQGLAIGVITQDCRPIVMAAGLQQWMGLSQPLAYIAPET
jgi:hypothetical protein